MSKGKKKPVPNYTGKGTEDPMLSTNEASGELNASSSSASGLADKIRGNKINNEIESAKTILGKEIDAENARLEEERRKVMNGEILSTQKRKRLTAFGRAGTIGAGGINAIGAVNSARKTLIGS